MSRAREESGFTLVELLVGATLMLVVMGGILSAMNGMETTTRSSNLRTEGQQTARTAMDALARKLRNGATAVAAAPAGIDKATSYDLVFQTADESKPAGSANASNLRRDRYCLDTSDPARGQLVLQTQRWTTATAPPAPDSTQCPSAAWGGSRVVADHVVNRRASGDRPVFVPNAATAPQVSRLSIQLYLDADRGSANAKNEVLLRSGIDLRNANQPPVASFLATPRASGKIALNASVSTDPENEPLSYKWYDGTTPLPSTNVTYDYTPIGPGDRTIRLVVYDPAGLRSESTVTVNMP